ncbi:hypothetical protein [Leisingera sp. ANG59]|uniref:hypothetical protein n=1 Tax=Leisingera sp. ANG59 TaxID=2675221 RepID=UPI001573C0CB|nr:hypothetical protein [Leisingera sp. ANG59]NSY38082.1 hypothetical protein [Leisingera sp. ANG59]
MRFLLSIAAALALAGCDQQDKLTGERELVPPREGIHVGSLYFAREKQTDALSTPVNLESLCFFDLEESGLTLEPNRRVADIDLLKKIEAKGKLDGLKVKFAEAGLSGNISKYYSYKLTNAYRSSISLVDAGELFESQSNGPRCRNWRKNVDQFGWAAYQIKSVTSGDIVLARKTGGAAGAEISAKLELLEPELSASLSKETSSSITGKSLVVSFSPIPR